MSIRNTNTLKLNLGCFDVIYDGWLNTNITPHIYISKLPLLPEIMYRLNILYKDRYRQHKYGIFKKITYLDVTKKFPLKGNHFKNIFTSHMLEHLYRNNAIFCLQECFRILQNGGIMRIAVPDLD